MIIDKEKLAASASRALLDTNVLIFALDGGKKHPGHRIARAFFEACADKKMRLLVAAPSLAEFEMKTAGRSLPLGPVLEVVPFDYDAAKFLAGNLGVEHLKSLRYTDAGVPYARDCLRYDAMIVACAGRHLASCIISTDVKHIPRIAAQARVRCLEPRYFEQAQGLLNLPPPRPELVPGPEDGGRDGGS